MDVEIARDPGDRTTARLEIEPDSPLTQLNGVLPRGSHSRSISFPQDRAWFRSLQETQGPSTEQALSRQGRYRQVRDNLRVKEVRVGDDDAAVRYVVCHNPAEAERDQTRRQQRVERIEAELSRLAEQRQRATTKAAREQHLRGECALRDHPTLSRYLRQTASGRLALDHGKIAAEQRLDGKYLLTTSDPSLSAEDVALGYKQLLEAERSFRDLKGILLLRPVFHRKDDRIRAHVLICFLALVIVRLAETRTGATWRTIRAELGQIRHGHFRSSEGDFTQTSELTISQRDLHTALGIPEPPRFGRITPAATAPTP